MLVRRPLDSRLRWFPKARFGMFVHFGLYSLLGRGEWVMYNENIPREEYSKLARRFNPHRFDAEEWVETARRAGARYITVTAKHHDGFCLFDSALTDYKITRTPFGRDLIGELVDACHRRKMRICLYYSQPDWHHPNFVHRRHAFKDLQYDRPGDEPNWPKFLEYVQGQVLELCTKYGRIDGIWFDGVHKSEREWRGRRLYRLIKQYQPGAVVNERAGFGDFFTPERRLAWKACAAGYAVEACQSICKQAWGYMRDATLFSSPHLIESLVRMSAAGGNYLLNIGPMPDGSLPLDQVRRLEEIGLWLAAHGKAIYGTEGCPLEQESDQMLYTRRRNRAYLHLLRWPETDEVFLKKLRRKPMAARLLKTKALLRVERGGEQVWLRGLPSSPPDPAVNVIELLFDDEEIFWPPPAPDPSKVLRLFPDRSLRLTADAAERSGFGPKGAVLEIQASPQGEPIMVAWRSTEQRATWRIESEKRLRCEVLIELACAGPFHGSRFEVTLAGQKLKGVVPDTKDQWNFRRVSLGMLEVPPGLSRLTVRPTELNFNYVFANVRQIILRPS